MFSNINYIDKLSYERYFEINNKVELKRLRKKLKEKLSKSINPKYKIGQNIKYNGVTCAVANINYIGRNIQYSLSTTKNDSFCKKGSLRFVDRCEKTLKYKKDFKHKKYIKSISKEKAFDILSNDNYVIYVDNQTKKQIPISPLEKENLDTLMKLSRDGFKEVVTRGCLTPVIKRLSA